MTVHRHCDKPLNDFVLLFLYFFPSRQNVPRKLGTPPTPPPREMQIIQDLAEKCTLCIYFPIFANKQLFIAIMKWKTLQGYYGCRLMGSTPTLINLFFNDKKNLSNKNVKKRNLSTKKENIIRIVKKMLQKRSLLKLGKLSENHFFIYGWHLTLNLCYHLKSEKHVFGVPTWKAFF